MLGRRIAHQFKNVFKLNPITTSIVAVLGVGKVAASVLSPWSFVEGLKALREGDEETAIGYFVGYAGLLTVSQIISLVQEKLLIRLGTSWGARLTIEAGEAFYNMPESVVDHDAGETHRFVNQFGGANQPGGVAYRLPPVIANVFTDVTEMITLNVYMWIRLGRVTAFSTAQTLLYMLSLKYLAPSIVDRVMAAIDRLYRGFSHAIVIANGYIPDTLCNQQQAVLDRFRKYLVTELNPNTERSLNINVGARALPSILGGVALLAQLIDAVTEKLLTVDEMILLIFYSRELTNVLENFSRNLVEGIPSFGMFLNILEYMEGAEIPHVRECKVEPENASIKLVEVSYSYPNTIRPVLDRTSFEVKAGEVAMLTGPNGAGKSTLFKMLYGLAKPDKGSILFGEQDIAQLDPVSMRAACAIVSQKIAITQGGTFETNINCFNLPVSRDEIVSVMKTVGLFPEFTPENPVKFGRDDAKLSGGQQRKVVLARALLAIRHSKTIRYLFVDEGFTHLDAKSEESILEEFKKVIAEKRITTIMITHNLKRMQEVFPAARVIDITALRVGDEEKKSSSHSPRLFRRAEPTEVEMSVMDENGSSVELSSRMGPTRT